MYAVIFQAELGDIDMEYSDTVQRMRELATQHGCFDFISVTEGAKEISISYWPSKEHITVWKNNPEHKKAQELGRKKWYKSYRVEITEIVHKYQIDDNQY